MIAFRMMLVAAWLTLASYTAAVVAVHGMGLVPIFFGAIGVRGWPGQFNLDFLCFLMLSAAWTAWRNGFSPIGMLLGVAAFLGGAGFLLPYVLILSFRAGGDVASILVGRSYRPAM